MAKPSISTLCRSEKAHIEKLNGLKPSPERDKLLADAEERLASLRQEYNKEAKAARASQPKRERIYVSPAMKAVVHYLKGNQELFKQVSSKMLAAKSKKSAPAHQPQPAPAEEYVDILADAKRRLIEQERALSAMIDPNIEEEGWDDPVEDSDDSKAPLNQ